MAYILVLGSLNVDLVVRTTRMPGPGETVTGEGIQLGEGGKGANQAAACALAGAPVRMLGSLGRDEFASRLLDSLVRCGVDVRYIKSVEGATGSACVLLESSGENRIIISSGANGLLTVDDVEAWKSHIAGASLLLIQLEIPFDSVQRAIGLAHTAGVPVLLDPAPVVADVKQVRSLLQGIWCLTPNQSEAEFVTGTQISDIDSAAAAARRIRDMGVDVAIVTLGAAGAVAACADGVDHYPPFLVQPADSTGAGDALCGALAAAAFSGNPQAAAIRRAMAAGALAVTGHGAQSSLPDAKAVTALLRRRGGEGWPRRLSGR